MSINIIKTKQKDNVNKNINIYTNENKLNNLIKIDKFLIVVHIKKIDKLYDYIVLQSICLIDTITAQKPKLKVLKCKYTFGAKLFSYSCKVNLRKRKTNQIFSLFHFVILSEIKRRHISILSTLNDIDRQFQYTFAIRNTNVFLKLDEFYFKWNYPIVFTIVIRRMNSSSDFSFFQFPSSLLPF